MGKASLMELKAMAKPHMLIEKTMQIVCALRGYKQLNWNTAKEFLSRQGFKTELLGLTAKSVRPQDVLRAQQILTQKTNTMLTPENL